MKKQYDWRTAPAIEELPEGSFEYQLTPELMRQFGFAVEDTDPLFPTIAGRHHDKPKHHVYERDGHVINTRTMLECFNPPRPGQRLVVTGRIAGRYEWRARRYIVTDATCRDEDGRLIDRISTIHMYETEEVDKKWR